jgi:hypothetical protein
MEHMKDEIWRIRNRQVARLLTNLKGFQLPDIVIDGIKKYFDYFATDIENMVNMENTNGQDTNGNR